ncbi:farnesyl-diphosphate synthase [Desulfosarcina alkanivorans]|jgi:geranylgeranyl diphosphate synthase type II|uniref:Farnesyl-diphosphate synthase n=1 Tax=Desulfosarcina alkanivorans TaxID=571177 RepID=A0A5K7YJR5_9BACT|nr:farnesyl diphosphate synthase [Desulfosarcina alkanivorans]BBO67021.1 farnesyl-diphosphate synthase [Desulfosarcina alkanivorans]
MFDLKSYLEAVRQEVDERLRRFLVDLSPPTRISQAMAYSVMAGGKRLRPVLCVAAAETVGGSRSSVLPLACALELIHTYSLIHDDLPAMDDDEKRRGKPTCHVRFDEATAILAGDALLTLAFEILATTGGQRTPHEGLKWMTAIARVASAVGFRGMIEGQMQDMAFEGTLVSEPELERLHRLKTGRLIEAAVGVGALVGGASSRHQNALHVYAQNIGLAFQVADDLLNVTGDPQRLGKAVGTDRIRGKNTYPSLMGLDGARTLAAQLVDNALKALDTFDNKADSLRAIAHYVIERNR